MAIMLISWKSILQLGKPSCKKSAVFFNIVQTGGHNGQTVAPEEILFESPCRANSETKMAKA